MVLLLNNDIYFFFNLNLDGAGYFDIIRSVSRVAPGDYLDGRPPKIKRL